MTRTNIFPVGIVGKESPRPVKYDFLELLEYETLGNL